MTKREAQWLAGSMMKEGWPEVWVEASVSPEGWRVVYRRRRDESPRYGVRLSAAIKDRCERELARGVESVPVEVLTPEEAADRSRPRDEYENYLPA